MRIGSLFSGYGGLDLASLALFEGSEVAWHCEWADAPARILDHHWPGVPNFRDVTEIDWTTAPPVDILTGGYPCQPFSAAGQRKGTDDERHLWPYVREAIRHLRPRYTLLENVAGHRSLGFDRVLGDLAEDGMHVRWTSLRASDVGAPHHRERLFILVTDPASGGPEGVDGVAGRGAACGGRERLSRGGHRGTPTNTEGAGPQGNELPGWSRPQLAGPVGDQRVPTDDHCIECGQGSGQPGAGESEESAHFGGVAVLPDAEGERRRARRLRERARATVAESDRDRGIDWGSYAPAVRRWERLTRPAPAPTELNKNDRPRLNAAFAEWMMGLPAGWVTDPAIGITRGDQLKAIGNGVCPQQAIAAYSQLLDALEVAA